MASQGDAEGVRLGTRPHELSSYRLRVGYIQRHLRRDSHPGRDGRALGKKLKSRRSTRAGIFAFRKSITSRGRMEKLRNFCTRRASAQRCAFAARVKAGGEHDEESGQRTSALQFGQRLQKSLIEFGSLYWKYIPSGEGIRFVTWYDAMGSRIGFGLE